MIAALFALLFQLLASWADQPAPTVVAPHAAMAPAPAVGPVAGATAPTSAAPTVATPAPAPEDYPAQLPEEAIGGARCGAGPQVVVSIAPDGTPMCG